MARFTDRLDVIMQQTAAQTADSAPPPPAASESAATRTAGTSLALRPPPPVLARPGISPSNAGSCVQRSKKIEEKAVVPNLIENRGNDYYLSLMAGLRDCAAQKASAEPNRGTHSDTWLRAYAVGERHFRDGVMECPFIEGGITDCIGAWRAGWNAAFEASGALGGVKLKPEAEMTEMACGCPLETPWDVVREVCGGCGRPDGILGLLETPFQAPNLGDAARVLADSELFASHPGYLVTLMPKIYSGQNRVRHQFGCKTLDGDAATCGCQVPVTRVEVTPIPHPGGDYIGFSGKPILPPDDDLVAFLRHTWPGARHIQRAADRIEALEGLVEGQRASLKVQDEVIANQDETITALRRELEMQSAAESASLGFGYRLTPPEVWLNSRTHEQDDAGGIDFSFLLPRMTKERLGWCGCRVGGHLIADCPQSMSAAEQAKWTKPELREVDPPSCTCPGPCIAPHHEQEPLGIVDYSRIEPSQMLDPPVVATIAGHRFAGVGSSRCCVLPKHEGKDGELCGRYWDEVKDAQHGSWDGRLVAHIGGLTSTEINEIQRERERLEAMEARMIGATSDLAGRSLRG